jgi:uncharacterized Zn-finger protein
MSNESPEKTCASMKQYYDITQKDLPLCCPMPTQRLWDSHPRVYLPIEKTGKATCPYCDAEFTLILKT